MPFVTEITQILCHQNLQTYTVVTKVTLSLPQKILNYTYRCYNGQRLRFLVVFSLLFIGRKTKKKNLFMGSWACVRAHWQKNVLLVRITTLKSVNRKNIGLRDLEWSWIEFLPLCSDHSKRCYILKFHSLVLSMFV